MKRNGRLLVQACLAGVAVALALLLATSTISKERIDPTVLFLLGAAAAIILVPWDRLASLKAAGVEITLNLPQVREAINGLPEISWDGERIDTQQVRRALERLGDEKIQAVSGSRVLWIDDNPSEIVALRRLLRALGADIKVVTSTLRARELLKQDNDFDLLISDLMRNAPSECVTFEWCCQTAGASVSCKPEVPKRNDGTPMKWDDGTPVEFEVRSTPEGACIHQRREGVNFVRRLRNEHEDSVGASLPVLFYASFDLLDAIGYARSAEHQGVETHVTNSAETLIPTAIEMLDSSRSNPITVGGPKKLLVGNSVAGKTILISDVSGDPIDDKNAATVTIKYADARRGQVALDVNASEVEDLASKGTKQARRGRKPKATS